MFDIGWTELLLIGIVALIVVGPKDLPGMFRTLGRFTAKARQMAREFQRSLEAAADEAGVGDIQKDFRKAASPKSMGLDFMKDMADDFRDPEFDADASKRRIEETKRLEAERKAKSEAEAPAKPERGEHVKALAAQREAEKANVAERVAAAKEKADAQRAAAATAKAEAEAAPAKPKRARSPAKTAAKPAAAKAATTKTAAKAPAAKPRVAKAAPKAATTPRTRKPAAAKPKADT
jgi:sec-independent protein translocase protein TatB